MTLRWLEKVFDGCLELYAQGSWLAQTLPGGCCWSAGSASSCFSSSVSGTMVDGRAAAISSSSVRGALVGVSLSAATNSVNSRVTPKWREMESHTLRNWLSSVGDTSVSTVLDLAAAAGCVSSLALKPPFLKQFLIISSSSLANEWLWVDSLGRSKICPYPFIFNVQQTGLHRCGFHRSPQSQQVDSFGWQFS